jgi:hypothetical protein
VKKKSAVKKSAKVVEPVATAPVAAAPVAKKPAAKKATKKVAAPAAPVVEITNPCAQTGKDKETCPCHFCKDRQILIEKFNFRERVAKLMKDGHDLANAEDIATEVIAKERRTATKPPVPVGTVCPINQLRIGQRFKFHEKPPADWKIGDQTYMGAVYFVNVARVQVEMEQKPKKREFFNNKTGIAVEFESVGHNRVNVAPETLVEVLDGVKDFALLTDSTSVKQKRSPKTAAQIEEEAMAKAAKKVAKKAEKAAKKVAATNATVKLVKMPAEGVIKGYALAILETLKANGKKLTAVDLVKKLKTDTKNANGQQAVWDFHRKKLVDGGFIELTA